MLRKGKWSVTIYINHHAVADIHNLPKWRARRIMRDLWFASRWGYTTKTIAGRIYQ